MGLRSEGETLSSGNLFACDVGNTRASIALVIGGRIEHVVRVPLAGLEGLRQALQISSGEVGAAAWPAIISSVNPQAAEQLAQMLSEVGAHPVLLAGRDVKPPIAISPQLVRPERIGTDRLLAALAAWHRHKRPAVVVDIGTAITVDSVDESGSFQGGAILPGPQTAAWSLHGRTAALPEVALMPGEASGAGERVAAIGLDTESAIRAGLVYGAAGAIDRIVDEQLHLLAADAAVIVTGGGYELLAPYLRAPMEYAANLVLEGLVACVLQRTS